MTSQITEGNDAFENHPQKLTESYWIETDGRRFATEESGNCFRYGYLGAAKTAGMRITGSHPAGEFCLG